MPDLQRLGADVYIQVREYVIQLEVKLAEVHRQSQRLIERQSKLGASMSDFGASMVELGKFESGPLAQKFQQLGARADTLAAASQVPFQPCCLLSMKQATVHPIHRHCAVSNLSWTAEHNRQSLMQAVICPCLPLA